VIVSYTHPNEQKSEPESCVCSCFCSVCVCLFFASVLLNIRMCMSLLHTFTPLLRSHKLLLDIYRTSSHKPERAVKPAQVLRLVLFSYIHMYSRLFCIYMGLFCIHIRLVCTYKGLVYTYLSISSLLFPFIPSFYTFTHTRAFNKVRLRPTSAPLLFFFLSYQFFCKYT